MYPNIWFLSAMKEIVIKVISVILTIQINTSTPKIKNMLIFLTLEHLKLFTMAYCCFQRRNVMHGLSFRKFENKLYKQITKRITFTMQMLTVINNKVMMINYWQLECKQKNKKIRKFYKIKINNLLLKTKVKQVSNKKSLIKTKIK